MREEKRSEGMRKEREGRELEEGREKELKWVPLPRLRVGWNHVQVTPNKCHCP